MSKIATTPGTGAGTNPEFESIFARLRKILQKHSTALTVTADASDHYCLEGSAGPAALRVWAGRVKRATIPVAWAQIGKAYVSYHLMGVYGMLHDGISKGLKARMQGKTCFNFKVADEKLFSELDRLTARGIADLRKAGYISEKESAS